MVQTLMLRFHKLFVVLCVIVFQLLLQFWTNEQGWRKGLISYFKDNDVTTLKKHVDVDHGLIAKKVEEKVNNNMKSPIESQFAKKVYNNYKCHL